MFGFIFLKVKEGLPNFAYSTAIDSFIRCTTDVQGNHFIIYTGDMLCPAALPSYGCAYLNGPNDSRISSNQQLMTEYRWRNVFHIHHNKQYDKLSCVEI